MEIIQPTTRTSKPLTEEQKTRRNQSIQKYLKGRYNTDTEYRNGVLKMQSDIYHNRVKNNPDVMMHRRIVAYLALVNTKHKADMKIKQTSKFHEYEIYYDDESKTYKSKCL
jgi:hypothetical protein